MTPPIILPKFLCCRCQHEWHPRKPERPVVCPRCKSAWWNKPRKTA
jgi:DNA-directed RNA polymerase subunit RPC12/RpoP